MKQACHVRRGSALLIVLGMVAFLVISAVSFSIFMRQNRLPSSFTRQRTNALMLTKAALASALSDLDNALADDPYPGVGHRGGSDRCEHMDWRGTRCFNRWMDRVFWNSDENVPDGDVMTYRSISVLPLEGVGYLPPSLINAVRYWGRRAPSAGRYAPSKSIDSRVDPYVYASNWKDLGYDSGRYVYVAVNVSDYFDINRLHADLMRDSSASNRISLSYLFENPAHTESPKGTDKFDQTVDKARKSAEGPFASLLDYNLWLGNEGSGLKIGDGELKSPFFEFASGRSKKEIVRDPETAKLQTFITQSWYPLAVTNASTVVIDEEATPLQGVNQSLDDLQKNAKSRTMSALQQRLNIASLAALYDYLDKDDEPISLALPTIERTPMLTGVQLQVHNIQPEWNVERKSVDSGKKDSFGNPIKNIKLRYSLRSLGSDAKVIVNLATIFPFRREGLFNTGSFKAQVLGKFFFMPVGTEVRARLSTEALMPMGEEEWKPGQAKNDIRNTGLITIASQQMDVKVPKKISTEEETLIDIPFMQDTEINFSNESIEKLVAYAATYPEGRKQDNYVYDADGLSGERLKYIGDLSGYQGKATEIDPAKGGEYALCALFWVRIINGDGKTVDLAPATLQDDKLYNGHALPKNQDDFDKACGPDTPYFPVQSATAVFSLTPDYFKALEEPKSDSTATATSSTATERFGLSIYCADPRFNYAPEDWFKVGENGMGMVKASDWKEKTDSLRAKDDCDRDVFMFVANQGYLQSVGEIFMLPYTGRMLTGRADPFSSEFFNESKYDGAWATGPEDTANHAFVWRTYFGWGSDTSNSQFADVYNWDMLDSRKGVYVNPYTEDINIFMAALANTPYDWSICATNESEFLKVSEEASKLCFNEYSEEPSAKLKWEDLKKVGEELRAAFRSGKDPFTASDWFDRWDEEGLLGHSSPAIISSVDRKFLYAFWRNCLQNRQHLFLVFVRAEPMVVAGAETTDTTQTPAQLGGRAVALVWRDPKKPNVGEANLRKGEEADETTCPHRTRILFYHQFDK